MLTTTEKVCLPVANLGLERCELRTSRILAKKPLTTRKSKPENLTHGAATFFILALSFGPAVGIIVAVVAVVEVPQVVLVIGLDPTPELKSDVIATPLPDTSIDEFAVAG